VRPETLNGTESSGSLMICVYVVRLRGVATVAVMTALALKVNSPFAVAQQVALARYGGIVEVTNGA
jgi:hypothetical protein